jgi:HAD superfamily hydrolase (TIGR01509 family)
MGFWEPKLDKLNLACTGIEAALFDLDGVLIDSLHVWHKIGLDFLNEKGFALTAQVAEDIKDMSFMQSAQYFVDKLNLNATPQMLIEDWNARAYAPYAKEVGLMPGADAYVKRLAKSVIKLAVVTASDALLSTVALQRLGIAEAFAAIVTEIGTGLDKSRPEIFLHAAKILNISPGACMVFEDSLYAAKAAKAAGMKVCALCGSVRKEKEAFCAVADYCFESLEELMA